MPHLNAVVLRRKRPTKTLEPLRQRIDSWMRFTFAVPAMATFFCCFFCVCVCVSRFGKWKRIQKKMIIKKKSLKTKQKIMRKSREQRERRQQSGAAGFSLFCSRNADWSADPPTKVSIHFDTDFPGQIRPDSSMESGSYCLFSWFYRFFSGIHSVLPGFTGFYWVLLGFT